MSGWITEKNQVVAVTQNNANRFRSIVRAWDKVGEAIERHWKHITAVRWNPDENTLYILFHKDSPTALVDRVVSELDGFGGLTECALMRTMRILKVYLP